MRVHVVDRLPGFPAGVEDDPVPDSLDALGVGDLTRHGDDFVKQSAARGGERCHVRKMPPRDHEDMCRRLRVDVTERDRPLPVYHDRGRDLSASDPAEQAVWHTTIIVGAGRARCGTAYLRHLRRQTATLPAVRRPPGGAPGGTGAGKPVARARRRLTADVPVGLAEFCLPAIIYSSVVKVCQITSRGSGVRK